MIRDASPTRWSDGMRLGRAARASHAQSCALEFGSSPYSAGKPLKDHSCAGGAGGRRCVSRQQPDLGLENITPAAKWSVSQGQEDRVYVQRQAGDFYHL